MNQEKLKFWNERAASAQYPGSDDFLLKKLEQKFLLNHLKKGARVLDIGCGDGETLRLCHAEYAVQGTGIDFSDQMIQKAIKDTKEVDKLNFLVSSVLEMPAHLQEFDIIYTQRCLINLDSFEEQKEAIKIIRSRLKKNGIYIMIESTTDGLEATNTLRNLLELEPINAPWHNLFFNIKEVESLQTEDFYIEKFENISSMYHLVSRVLYAKLAAQKGEKLAYDSDLNLISMQLPQNIGNLGPVKGWIWRKK